MQVNSLSQLVEMFRDVDRSQPFPPSAMRVVRGKTTGTQKVALPQGYLASIDDATPPCGDDEDFGDGG
jgi:hypothetical protein